MFGSLSKYGLDFGRSVYIVLRRVSIIALTMLY